MALCGAPGDVVAVNEAGFAVDLPARAVPAPSASTMVAIDRADHARYRGTHVEVLVGMTSETRLRGTLGRGARSGRLQGFAALLIAVLSTWTVFGIGAAAADLVNRFGYRSEQQRV
jgi:hypothetical protein